MGDISRRAILQIGAFTGAGLWAGLHRSPGPRSLVASTSSPDGPIERFYVSIDGDDTWSGRLDAPTSSEDDGPFRTLHRARDAVRTLLTGGPIEAATEVVVLAGTYYLDEPLTFTPSDSGTEEYPVYWTASGEVVISGGHPITSSWTVAAGIAATTIADPWQFRSLFVDGTRQTLARFPNANALNPGASYLYHGGQEPNLIIAGIARDGDYIEHTFDVQTTDDYDLWLGVATTDAGVQSILEISIDGTPLVLQPISASGGFRTVAYSNAASAVPLTAGTHTLRIESNAGSERRVHLDAVVFTTNTSYTPSGVVIPPPALGENRAVLQLDSESSLIGSHSSIGFERFTVANVPASNTTQLWSEPSLVKASWATDPQARVELIPDLHYFTTSCELDSVNTTTGVLTVTQTSQIAPIVGSNHFYVAGVRDELDTPGEWYHNPSTGLLELIPMAGVDPNAVDVVAPKLSRVISFEGDATGTSRVEWITLRGFTISHAAATGPYVSLRSPTDAAVKLDSTRNCTIEDCTITAVDGYGIWLHLDSTENTIQHNEISDMGIGGVLLTAAVLDYGVEYDSRTAVQDLAPVRNRFLFNHIHGGGKVMVQAAGFNLGSRPASTALEAGNAIIGNHIHHMPRQGVFGFRNQGGNIVAYNHIHDVVLETSDAGAINLAVMTNVAAPILVRNNLIGHAPGPFRFSETRSKPFGFGLYADHATSHASWAQNTIYDAPIPAFMHGGQFNHYLDNVIADPGQLWGQDTDRVMWRNRARRTVLGNDLRPVERLFRITAVPPSMAQMVRDEPWRVLDSDLNVIEHPDADPLVEPLGSLTAWVTAGNDTNSIEADPQLADPANGDYSLEPASPAYGLGFSDFDPSNSGQEAAVPTPFDITDMAAVSAIAARSLSGDGRTATYAASVPEPGLYRVYGRRAISTVAPPHSVVTIEHRDGITREAFDVLVGPGRNPAERFGLYLGTYFFDASGTVTVFQPASAATWAPDDVVFLLAARQNLDAPTLPWESVLSTAAAKMQVNDTMATAINFASAHGTELTTAPGTTTIVTDNPAVVTVNGSGVIEAVGAGMARIRAITDTGSDVVRSEGLLIAVGDILWSGVLAFDDASIAVGETAAATFTGVFDSGATAAIAPPEVVFQSQKPSIATVNASGVVTGVATGTAVIVATVTRGGATATASAEISVAGPVTPLLRYSFDETASATVNADDLGTTPLAPATFSGIATRTATTPLSSGRALDLSTSGSGYVTPGTIGSAKLDGLSKFTISMWVRLEGDPAVYDRIVSRGNSFDWQINSGPRTAVVSQFRLGTLVRSLPALDLSQWTFVVFVGTGSRIAAYAGTTANSVAEIAQVNSTLGLAAAPGVELRVGGTTLTTADRTPPALVDEFRIYNRELPISMLESLRSEGL